MIGCWMEENDGKKTAKRLESFIIRLEFRRYFKTTQKNINSGKKITMNI